MMDMFSNRAHLRALMVSMMALGALCLSGVTSAAPKSPFVADQKTDRGAVTPDTQSAQAARTAQTQAEGAEGAGGVRGAETPKQSQPQSAGASSAPVSTGAVAEPELSEPPMISDPMQMRFKIKRLERNVSPDARRFSSPRVLTLTALGPITHLDESVWRGKRLAVFRAGMIDEKVGEIKIKSVYQATLQAEVVQDDLTRDILDRRGAARVVMIGDIARLEQPIKAPTRRRVRRRPKPRRRGQYERENMQWRL